jgi:hypothetical protein
MYSTRMKHRTYDRTNRILRLQRLQIPLFPFHLEIRRLDKRNCSYHWHRKDWFISNQSGNHCASLSLSRKNARESMITRDEVSIVTIVDILSGKFSVFENKRVDWLLPRQWGSLFLGRTYYDIAEQAVFNTQVCHDIGLWKRVVQTFTGSPGQAFVIFFDTVATCSIRLSTTRLSRDLGSV